MVQTMCLTEKLECKIPYLGPYFLQKGIVKIMEHGLIEIPSFLQVPQVNVSRFKTFDTFVH